MTMKLKHFKTQLALRMVGLFISLLFTSSIAIKVIFKIH